MNLFEQPATILTASQWKAQLATAPTSRTSNATEKLSAWPIAEDDIRCKPVLIRSFQFESRAPFVSGLSNPSDPEFRRGYSSSSFSTPPTAPVQEDDDVVVLSVTSAKQSSNRPAAAKASGKKDSSPKVKKGVESIKSVVQRTTK